MANTPVAPNRFKEMFFEAMTPAKFKDAVDELYNLAMSGTGDKIQLQALIYLLDRILGKPAVSEIIEQEGEIKINISHSEGRSKEEFEAIKQRAQAKWSKIKTEIDAEEDAESIST